MPIAFEMIPTPRIDAAKAWLAEHDVLIWWVAAGSFALTILTLLAIPFVVSRIPTKYFATKEAPPLRERSSHPALRWTLRLGKNLLGFVLVVIGLLLSVPLVPGQGLIIAVAGLLLLEFPGKRRFEMWVIRRRGLLTAINWFRARRGRPPLVVWSPEGLVTSRSPSPQQPREKESARP